MSRLEYYRLVAPVVADLNDEHTLLSPPGEEIGKLMSGGLLFPIRPIIREKRIFVRTNYSSDANLQPGSEILAINGTSSRELLDQLSQFAIGKNREHRLALVEKFFGTLLWIGNGYESPFNVSVRSGGKTFNEQVAGVPESVIQAKDKGPADSANNAPYSFRMLEDGKTGLLTIHIFGNPKESAAFLEQTFVDIKKKGIRALIIDLRENDGGFMGVSDVLLGYLTGKPISQLSRGESKVSVQSQQYLKVQTDNDTLAPYYLDGVHAHLQAQPGEVLTFKGNVVSPSPLAFQGKIYVLTGRGTYSAASLLAATVRDYHLGIFVGEETGGSGTQYSDPVPFEPPRTKLSGIIAHTLLVRASGTDNGKGVVPDQVIPTTPADILAGRDAALEHVLTLIRAGDGK
jgi:hypothetical protein